MNLPLSKTLYSADMIPTKLYKIVHTRLQDWLPGCGKTLI